MTAAFIAQLLTIGVAERIVAAGAVPPIYLSANIPAGDEHNHRTREPVRRPAAASRLKHHPTGRNHQSEHPAHQQGPDQDLRPTLHRPGALAAAAVVPLSSALAACAGSSDDSDSDSDTKGGTKSADNPFGMVEDSTTDAVIFNGGYGIDYVSSSRPRSCRTLPRLTVKVSPSTEIAQELQPRFVGGNPPDLIDNSGAERDRLQHDHRPARGPRRRPRRPEPRGHHDPRHPLRWRGGTRHLRRQVRRRSTTC